jgi:hypothetical protein
MPHITVFPLVNINRDGFKEVANAVSTSTPSPIDEDRVREIVLEVFNETGGPRDSLASAFKGYVDTEIGKLREEMESGKHAPIHVDIEIIFIGFALYWFFRKFRDVHGPEFGALVAECVKSFQPSGEVYEAVDRFSRDGNAYQSFIEGIQACMTDFCQAHPPQKEQPSSRSSTRPKK